MKEILEWSDDLYGSPQDDLVIPDQLWLAGFCVMKGVVRQFVAMPFGGAYAAVGGERRLYRRVERAGRIGDSHDIPS